MSSCNLCPFNYITSAAHVLPIGRRVRSADCSFGVGNSGGGSGIAAGCRTSAAAAGAGRRHSPAVNQTTAGIPASNKNAEADQETARPLANFHPTVWGDFFIQNLSSPSDQNQIDHAQVQRRVEMLKEQVRTMFSTSSSTAHDGDRRVLEEEEMKLVDALQRLGLAYHFEKEISEVLARIHASDQHSTVAASEDLRVVSLRFRLLRQGGYDIPSNEFNKFKDVHGHFKGSLRSDVEGLLSLYEASNCLGTREEDGILEEAMSFCRRELESMLDRLQPPFAAEVVRALDMPLVRRIQRLEAREYISFYEATQGREDMILELAKLDFNYVQSLHQEEIRELTRWWKELGLIKELSFARDRLVEGYSWSLMQYEPRLAHVRMMMTKIFCFMSILDDIYDSYGTLEELRLLTDVMNRWDIGEVEVLSEYMKIYFMALYDLIKEFEQKYYHAQHLKEACKVQSKLYLKEAEWCNEGHTPAFRDHLQVTERSSGTRLLTCGFFVCMGGDNINIAAQESVFDWLANNPKIVEASSTLGRLLGDISAHEVEEKRKHVASTVRCYMKEHGVSKETAHQKLREMGETAWKAMNEEWIKPSGIQTQLLAIPLDLARMVEVYYKGGEGYTNSIGKTKGIINLLLVKRIPL